MKAVILAGGKGTRLAPYTTVFPKPMLPVGERPILETLIRQLGSYGFKDIAVSVGYLGELIQLYFKNCNRLPKNIKITYVIENEPLGTAGSLSLVSGLKGTFLVMNGDVLTTLDYGKFIEFHRRNNGLVTIAMHKREVKIDYGVISTDAGFQVTGYNEKPELDYRVSMGIYAFEAQALEYIKPGQKLDFPELINILLKEGKKVQGYPSDDYWLDIGRHDDYEEAVKIFDKLKNKLFK